MQQATVNLFADMGVQPSSLQEWTDCRQWPLGYNGADNHYHLPGKRRERPGREHYNFRYRR